jgi:RNA polymerase sigma-70 factor (ECF subfamily)
MHNRTDGELMQLVLDKQHSALDELYERYVKLVYSFAMKSIREEQAAREIVQQVFTRLWVTEKGYDAKQGRFVNWILTITRNITIDHIRKQRKQEVVVRMEPQEWERLSDTHANDPEVELSRKWIGQEIRQAYRYLTASQIQLLELVYWQGFTLSEIAALNNEPLGTIKSRLHQCLMILRKHLSTLREG